MKKFAASLALAVTISVAACAPSPVQPITNGPSSGLPAESADAMHELHDVSPRAGGPGTLVTLTGRGFDPSPEKNQVSFNGVSALVTSASETTLVVTVPLGATNGPLSLTINGKTVHSASAFTSEATLATVMGLSPQGIPLSEVPITAKGIAIDADDNIYLTLPSLHRIAKVTTQGYLTFIAGTGVSGNSGDGGPALQAQIGSPRNIVVAQDGQVYFSDETNHVVRKIALDGTISTVAGTGQSGYSGDNGPAASAQLNTPYGLAFDPSGNLYIADYNNHRIRKVSKGTITTFAGNGQVGFSAEPNATQTPVHGPAEMVFDADGNLYYADNQSAFIRKITPDGQVSRFAGSGMKGNSSETNLVSTTPMHGATGLAMDASGSLYVSLLSESRIATFKNDKFYYVLGSTTSYTEVNEVPARGAYVQSLAGMAFDSSGNLIVVESGAARIRKVSASGTLSLLSASAAFGAPGTALLAPSGVAEDAQGNLYVADAGRHQIFKQTKDGTVTVVAGTGQAGFGDSTDWSPPQFNQPAALALDASGNLYVADTKNHRLRKIDSTGKVTTVAGGYASGFAGDNGSAVSAWLNSPSGVAVDAAGNLYIADRDNHRVRKVATTGTITTVAGTGTAGFSGDGASATSAQLNSPVSVAVDAAGNLYIADRDNDRIRKVDASGAISTVAVGNATMQKPVSVVVDGGGNLYVTEAERHTVRLVGPNGQSQVIAGASSAGQASAQLPASQALLNRPNQLYWSPAGRLLIVDSLNSAIRRLAY